MRQFVPILCFAAFLTGCEVVSGIFKAGYYTALILVFLVILLILFLIGYFRKK
jgi:hypothetical protein